MIRSQVSQQTAPAFVPESARTGRHHGIGTGMTSELIELGREAADQIAAEIRMGASLVHCQLLASQFYEALKLGFVAAGPPNESGTVGMAAALRRCLRAAVASLESSGQAQRRPVRPMLRVIQGGLASR